MKKYFIILLLLLASSLSAHEMVPTYPKWSISYLDDLLVTQMEMFNKRKDVEYYEVAVFDEDWNPIPFVTSYRIIKVKYLSRIKFEVYIRKKDKNRAAYICSRSKPSDEFPMSSGVSSMICSKFKD